MSAVERTVVQQIADAWGNDYDGVTIQVTDTYTDKPVSRDLTPDEARALAQALVLAADAVTPAPTDAAGGPQEPRGDTITPSAHRCATDVAKTPQIAAEAQTGERCWNGSWSTGICGRLAGHEGECFP
ncbi:hypothetical protein C5B94_03880 [Clavibacter michiganensis]|uniref:hypothetical protein n=1 Tax=Clavibacter michiganensis TaxID=28447 RepID=UPI000CE8D5C9|nr:hypothetical protein [Clavibacter michiganensis]PPF56069.1 hypothetical protein C5B94_03880 [Clavibacter michiganensis]